MSQYHIESMQDEHAVEVMAIFNHYIATDFSAFFEDQLPECFYSVMRDSLHGLPAVVAKKNSRTVAGFAFLRPYHPAPTMHITAEVTYFIHPEHARKGVGTLLLDNLIFQAKNRGILNLVASISSENQGSLNFHAKNDFCERGRLCGVGEKFGRHFDVVYMQRHIADNMARNIK